MAKRGRPRKYPRPEEERDGGLEVSTNEDLARSIGVGAESAEEEEVDEEPEPKEIDYNEVAFPPLQSLVPERSIRPGLEWAYIRGENIQFFMKEGWGLHPRAKSFELFDESWVVMVRGEPIPCSDAFIPRVYSEDIAA